MINEFAAAAFERTSTAAAQEFMSLSGPESVLDYGVSCARLELAKWVYALGVEVVDGTRDGRLPGLLRAAAAKRGTDLPALDAAERAGAAAAGPDSFRAVQDFAGPWLTAFAALQARVNEVMGRPTDPPPLAIHDLDHVARYFWSGWRYRQQPLEAGLMERSMASSAR